MSDRKLNFGAGPAQLPLKVLEKITGELLSHDGSGVSILEVSHRSSEFKKVIGEAKNLLKELMNIPDNYEILFMHGGGSGQFAAIPLNFRSLSKASPPVADFAVSGAWSKKAAEEAKKYVTVNKVFEVDAFHRIPPASEWKINPDSAFLWYCANETIDGVEFQETPEVPEGVNLVADISSNILSRPIDVAKHAAIIAGTQKNLGIGGLTIAIIRSDLIGRQDIQTPGILNYAEIAKHESLYNTPCVFAIYVTKLVLEWIKENGGIQGMESRAKEKSNLIYSTIEASNGFYNTPIVKEFRSRMNVPFRTQNNSELEAKFVKEAEALNMISLKGHRSVGGIRASIYNAVTLEQVQALVKFMIEFQQKNN